MLRFLSLIMALLATGATAQGLCGSRDLIAELPAEERAALATEAARQPFHEGLTWRATKPGSTVTVVGTIHLPDPRLDAIADRIAPAIRDADIVVLELTEEDQFAVQRMAAEQPERFFILEGPTLIDLLGDDWDLARQELTDRGIPPFFAAKFQPWYLSLTLAVPACAMQAIAEGREGLDGRLTDIAKDAGTPMAALDEPSILLDLFGNDPLEDQVEALRFALRSEMNADAMMSTTIESYFDGRTAELWAFTQKLAREIEGGRWADEMAALEAEVLIGRNEDWAPRIRALINGQDAVIAVGAAHLPGETGVLRTLERAGYRVEKF